jgi:murein L,D-transpeptidase YafK
MPTLPPPDVSRSPSASRSTARTRGARLKPYFAAAHVAYPPARVALVGLKQERELLVYAAGPDGAMRWLRSYPILAASGRWAEAQGRRQAGAGRRVRDRVAEPEQPLHLSLRVGYPNAFDLAQAIRDGRTTSAATS